MLRVTVEMLPQGLEAEPRMLCGMEIFNVGGTDDFANYQVRLSEEGQSIGRVGVVNAHPCRKEHVWALVAKALASVGYDGKSEARKSLDREWSKKARPLFLLTLFLSFAAAEACRRDVRGYTLLSVILTLVQFVSFLGVVHQWKDERERLDVRERGRA